MGGHGSDRRLAASEKRLARGGTRGLVELGQGKSKVVRTAQTLIDLTKNRFISGST